MCFLLPCEFLFCCLFDSRVVAEQDALFVFLEKAFEAVHLWPIAQRIRAKQASWKNRQAALNLGPWAEKAIELDLRLREVAQRETALKDKCERLANQPTTFAVLDKKQLHEQDAQIEKWRKELKDLDVEYWEVERQSHANDECLPSGPNRRAYLSLHKRPNWYLHPWLCQDCAGRGGCCSRLCGCCQKSRSPSKPKALGHCTKECQCCIKARGFELDPRLQRSYQPNVHLSGQNPPNGYSRRMYQAWQWGYRVESYTDS